MDIAIMILIGVLSLAAMGLLGFFLWVYRDIP